MRKDNVPIFRIIDNKGYPEIGRCVHCEARDYCGGGIRFKCKCTMKQHYINIKKERLKKLKKLNELH